ncbi:MAG: 3-oxoacyl-ACP reductase FabG [Candidatus Helarchaeota archaeon]
MRLKDTVAIVTGAARGIGKAIALKFAREGADIVCLDILKDLVEQTAKECEVLGRKAIAIHCDVGNRDDVKKAEEIIRANFNIDDIKLILVNNAGIIRDALFFKMTNEQWDEVIRVNLTGVFNMCKIAAPIMTKNKWGKIINISSVMGKVGNVGQANYTATKAALVGLTKTLAKELSYKGTPINVNAIQPGLIKTDMTASMPQKIFDMLVDQVPLKRPGEPEDIANVALFLASEEASYITGEVILVSGGQFM